MSNQEVAVSQDKRDKDDPSLAQLRKN